jgi:predicted nuclease with RNAse H fold
MTTALDTSAPRAITTRTVGIDLAAEPKRTALAVIAWSTGGARLEHLVLNVTDEMIVDAAATAERIGIDCALGWPIDFVEFVSAHAAAGPTPAVDGGADWRRLLAYRETDRVVRERSGRWPLSVSTDRLGLTAMRCAGLLGRLAASGTQIDRSGVTGAVAEVYPAATLRLWDIDASGYRVDAATRGTVLDEIARRAPWLDLGEHRALAEASADALDAIIAALVARVAALGRFDSAPEAVRDQARREGWIILPTCGIEDLLAPHTSH